MPIDDITGRAVAIVWPLDRAGWLSDHEETFAAVPEADGRAVSPARVRAAPSLRVERALQRDGHRVLAGMDEVGRGALAGPVTRRRRRHRRDLPHRRRRASRTPSCSRRTPASGWCRASSAGRSAHAVGHASADEIDEIGIIAALRLAGCRALASVAATGIRPDLVILDGNHDWLTSPEDVGLLAFAHEDRVDDPAGDDDDQGRPEVLVGGRGERARQGAARPASWSTSAPTTLRRLRLGREQGLRRARAHGRAAPRSAPATCTAGRGGCPAWTMDGARMAESMRPTEPSLRRPYLTDEQTGTRVAR